MAMRSVDGPIDPRNLKEGEHVSGATFKLENGSTASHEVSGDHSRYNNLVQHYIHGRNAVSMRTNISSPHGGTDGPLRQPMRRG